MLVTIITPTPDDISAFGVRSLSSYLKGFGYKTRIIFLPGSIKKSDPQGKYMYQYSTRTLDEVSDLVKGSCLIGISFMTYYFDRAVQLTKVLKQQCKTPIIWGGIHATVRPKEALKYADMVCVGEGEETLLELARKIENGENYFQVKNLWLKENGHIIKNSLRPLIKDLDSLPFFDYSLEEHYCFDYARGHIREIDDALFQELLPVRPDLDGNFRVCYRTMTDRGCPHKCTYCSISIQKELYEGEGFFRKRKVDGVIEELRCILNRFPFVKTIQFFDDTFFARNTAEIEKFSALYKQHVGLPFHAQCSPRTITERKLQSLVDAGLIFTEMGIQTGSRRVKALYNRTESNAETIEAARIIHKYKHKLLPPDYHVILNNPWETDQDKLDTLNLLLQIPKPYSLQLSTLQFFPGTKLYDKGKEDGFFKNDVREIYRVPFLAPRIGYLDFLIYLTGKQWISKKILTFLASPHPRKWLNRESLIPLFRTGFILLEKGRLFAKGLEALAAGDFARIKRYLKRAE